MLKPVVAMCCAHSLTVDGREVCSELEFPRYVAEAKFNYEINSAELNRLPNDRSMAFGQDFLVGLGGIEPPTSALSGLLRPTR